MLNGLNKYTHLILIVIIGVLLAFFLATRPKIVVSKDNQTVQQSSKASVKTQNHAVNVPEETKLEVLKLKQSLGNDEKSNLATYAKIANSYTKTSLFDSAGFYFEKIAIIQSDINSWTIAGDSYFQAFNIGLSPEVIEKSIEKTRFCYNKVLQLQPENLHVKTNLAMTYVRSDSPMKAIGMLREVVAQEPNYVPAIMSLGGLSMQSGQYDKAVNRFENVLKIDPSNINAKMGLAYSNIELGKKTEAKNMLEEVLKQNNDPVIKEEVTKTLNSLK